MKSRIWLDRVIRAAAGLAVCASLAGCGGTEKAATRETRTQVSVEPKVVPVTTAAVIERNIPLIVRATGSFVADESSDVASQVSGQITATPVNIGDVVSAGQVILRLDDRDAKLRLNQAAATLQQAQAQAEKAKADAGRSNELMQSGVISRSDNERLIMQLTTANAAEAQASAMVASAEKAVDDAVIRAPFAGHVSARPVAVGEYVSPASKVVTVLRIQPIKLELQVPEQDAAKLRAGMPVIASVAAYPGQKFAGVISARNLAIDPNSRAMTIEAKFPNADSRLTPGMFGSAELHLPATEAAVLVPRSAVVRIANGESSGIYVVDQGKARIHVVQPGEDQDGMLRILSGVERGAIVAVSNLDQLFDGATVRLDASMNVQGKIANNSR